MELYVVHIHQIEDSYPFGVFDSFIIMRSKIWELIRKTNHKDNNNWNDVLNLKVGEMHRRLYGVGDR